MNGLPTALYRAAQVRELDRIAIEAFSIPGYQLMQRAGEAAFAQITRHWPRTRHLQVYCGTGNNGGDGYVIAALALASGWSVQVVQLGDATRIQGDALKAREDYLAAGGAVVGPGQAGGEADLLVDAVFGTGLEREVEGVWREAIEAMNRHLAPVLAVDIPSGLHADTGRPLGAAVRASRTISFIGLKQGLFTGEAAEFRGVIAFHDLGVPEAVFDGIEPGARRLSRYTHAACLAPRSRAAHKGHFGHVLVVGGDLGMGGAVRMAGEAAARAGAGLVSLATHPLHAAAITATRPELMCRGVEDAKALGPLLERATVIALGPGLGQDLWGRTMFDAVFASGKPLVVDADALRLLAARAVQRPDWVLTPHPGEAAALLGLGSAEVQADRFAAVTTLRARFDGVCVLKGAGTLIASPLGVGVCAAGNPGMASGGMGDVLTGLIAGLLAQGFNPQEAAETGVCLHAAAAERGARAGERGMLASDLFEPLRALLNPVGPV